MVSMPKISHSTSLNKTRCPSSEIVHGRSATLSPQLRSKPIGGSGYADTHILKSFILFRLKQYPGILAGAEGHGGDIFSNMGVRTLNAYFSYALSMEVKRGDGNENIERVFAVPCLVNSREFFVSIIVFKDGSVKVEASRVEDGAIMSATR